MKHFIKRYCCVLILLLVILNSSLASASDSQLTVSFPKLKFENTDEIVRFEVTIKSGDIISVEKTRGWSITIVKNESSEIVIWGNPHGWTGGPTNSAELPTFTIEANEPVDGITSNLAVAAILIFSPKSTKARTIKLSHDMMIIRKKGI
jgi:hypothetical protein